jgi:hypothetical protein
MKNIPTFEAFINESINEGSNMKPIPTFDSFVNESNGFANDKKFWDSLSRDEKNKSDSALKVKIKIALERLKRTGKATKEEVLSFLEQLLRNLDEH